LPHKSRSATLAAAATAIEGEGEGGGQMCCVGVTLMVAAVAEGAAAERLGGEAAANVIVLSERRSINGGWRASASGARQRMRASPHHIGVFAIMGCALGA
jgi:hypothetical protein